jgi:hypothetical protein
METGEDNIYDQLLFKGQHTPFRCVSSPKATVSDKKESGGMRKNDENIRTETVANSIHPTYSVV